LSQTRPRRSALEIAAFAVSVLMVLIYAQPWGAFLPDQTSDAGSNLARIAFFPMYALGVGLIGLRPWPALRGLAGQPFLILLLCVAAASSIWSVAPDETHRRVVAIIFSSLCAVALGARWRWPQLSEVFAAAFAILSVGSLLLGLLAPTVGRMTDLFPGAWRGFWVEKNVFGELMAFGFLVFAAAGLLNRRRALLWWPFAALDLALLLLSTSKTSLAALALGVAALGFVGLARKGGVAAIAATYAAVVALAALAGVLILAPDTLFALLGKDATLTGRTKVWAAVWRLIGKRPWLGYGYAAVWRDDTGWGPLAWIVKWAGFKPDHAHNSWLEQWLGMGLAGLGAWALYYLATLARAVWAAFTDDGALLALPILVVFTLMSLTESVAVVYNDLRWLVFVALSIRLALPSSGELRVEPR
jgi:O-antigen ligase